MDITLIIPTFNRHEHLRKLINYYASKNTQLSFLILDSSDEETAKLNRQLVTLLGEKAKHIVYPSSEPFAKKLLNGLKMVTTSFCAFCADDDLVFIDGLSQALTYLQAHPDCVCVDGIYLNFNPIGKDIHLKIEYATKGIQATDPGARVFKLCQKYESLFYGVFRTQHAIDIFSGVSKNTSLHYQELFQATSALLIGKSHRLPIFYAARQHCVPAETTRDKWQTYYWFTDNAKEFLDHYLIYREELWSFYQTHVPEQKYSKESFFQLLDIAHAMYFGLGCPPEYFHTVLQSNWPNDLYQKANEFQDNICNQLKSRRRLWCENFIEQLILQLPKTITYLYSWRAKKSLNRKIFKSTKTRWKCVLEKDLRWLASVALFRNTYRELCLYMCGPKE